MPTWPLLPQNYSTFAILSFQLHARFQISNRHVGTMATDEIHRSLLSFCSRYVAVLMSSMYAIEKERHGPPFVALNFVASLILSPRLFCLLRSLFCQQYLTCSATFLQTTKKMQLTVAPSLQCLFLFVAISGQAHGVQPDLPLRHRNLDRDVLRRVNPHLPSGGNRAPIPVTSIQSRLRRRSALPVGSPPLEQAVQSFHIPSIAPHSQNVIMGSYDSKNIVSGMTPERKLTPFEERRNKVKLPMSDEEKKGAEEKAKKNAAEEMATRQGIIRKGHTTTEEEHAHMRHELLNTDGRAHFFHKPKEGLTSRIQKSDSGKHLETVTHVPKDKVDDFVNWRTSEPYKEHWSKSLPPGYFTHKWVQHLPHGEYGNVDSVHKTFFHNDQSLKKDPKDQETQTPKEWLEGTSPHRHKGSLKEDQGRQIPSQGHEAVPSQHHQGGDAVDSQGPRQPKSFHDSFKSFKLRLGGKRQKE